MFEKLNKLQIVHMIAFVIVLTCSWNAITGTPEDRKDFRNISLVGVIGWAFTRQQGKTREQ